MSGLNVAPEWGWVVLAWCQTGGLLGGGAVEGFSVLFSIGPHLKTGSGKWSLPCLWIPNAGSKGLAAQKQLPGSSVLIFCTDQFGAVVSCSSSSANHSTQAPWLLPPLANGSKSESKF